MKKIIETIKKYISIVGIWRVVVAAIVSVAILYSYGIVGLCIGKPEWMAINAAFWFMPGVSPGILLGVLVGILILIVISPKSKRKKLKQELKITWGEIKQQFVKLADKARNWLTGKDLEKKEEDKNGNQQRNDKSSDR